MHTYFISHFYFKFTSLHKYANVKTQNAIMEQVTKEEKVPGRFLMKIQ